MIKDEHNRCIRVKEGKTLVEVFVDDHPIVQLYNRMMDEWEALQKERNQLKGHKRGAITRKANALESKMWKLRGEYPKLLGDVKRKAHYI